MCDGWGHRDEANKADMYGSALALGGGYMAVDKGCVVGDAWAAGCGVCEARECQGRGAAAVQGGWHAFECFMGCSPGE